MLKASARNCKLNRSLILNFLKNEVSTLAKPGPRIDPRDTSPNVPGIGSVKAFGSNQWSTLPKTALPLKFGFQLGTSVILVSPVPELLKPITGVSGKPPWAVMMPFHCQPPINWFFQPLASPAKRCPRPNGN